MDKILLHATLFLILLIAGASFGSFFQVFLERSKKREDWIGKRSFCPFCQKTLGILELIPVFSFVWQKGKCKTCRSPIPRSYLLGELTTGFLFYLTTITGLYYPTFLAGIPLVFLFIFFLYTALLGFGEKKNLKTFLAGLLFFAIYQLLFLSLFSLFLGLA